MRSGGFEAHEREHDDRREAKRHERTEEQVMVRVKLVEDRDHDADDTRHKQQSAPDQQQRRGHRVRRGIRLALLRDGVWRRVHHIELRFAAAGFARERDGAKRVTVREGKNTIRSFCWSNVWGK